MTSLFEPPTEHLSDFSAEHNMGDAIEANAERSPSALYTSFPSMHSSVESAPVAQHGGNSASAPEEEALRDHEDSKIPLLLSSFSQFAIDVNVIRCSMPSLSKMPSAARHLVSNMFSFLNGSPTPQPGSSDKVGAQFSTPQVDRKNRVNVSRRMSDGQTNGVVGKVHPGASNINMKRNHQLERIKVKNVERWEPNVYEKELLRRTWSDEFEFLYYLGSSIYMYIFEHNPNCKQLFPQLIKYGDNWKDSREFRSQALKFVQTISQVVKNIYHMERLEPYLYGIGQRHCKFADRGFKPEYWEDFQDAMEHSLAEHMNGLADLDERQRTDAVTVWRTLALYIIAHMKAGYFDGLKSVNKHPPLA